MQCMGLYLYVCMYVCTHLEKTYCVDPVLMGMLTKKKVVDSIQPTFADYSSLLGGSLSVAAKGSVKVTYKCAEHD